MRKLIFPLLFLALWLNLAACSIQGAAAPTNAPIPMPTVGPTTKPASSAGTELGGAAWKWAQSITADGTATSISDSGRFTVQFLPGDSRVGIATACQSATGTYTTDGTALQIQLEATTNAICPGDKLSGRFIAELGSVESYSFDGNDLILKLAANNGSLRLTH